jgi:hypothetical protein
MRYVWSFPEEHKPRIVTDIEQFGAHLGIIRLRGDANARTFLTTLGAD